MKQEQKAIRLVQVTKRYPLAEKELTVLEEVDLILPYGEITALMGPSGSGKTTIARLLLGLELPDSGSIEGVPKAMAAVFQEDRLVDSRDPVSNIRAAVGRSVPVKEIEAMLCRLGLEGHLTEETGSFSGGMRRRVAIARALCAKSDFLVLDEPFKGLDDATKEKVMTVLQSSLAGKTVLLITHDVQDTEKFGAKTIHLSQNNSGFLNAK